MIEDAREALDLVRTALRNAGLDEVTAPTEMTFTVTEDGVTMDLLYSFAPAPPRADTLIDVLLPLLGPSCDPIDPEKPNVRTWSFAPGVDLQ